MSRGKFAAWTLGGLVFVVGVFTLLQQTGGFVSHIANAIVHNAKSYSVPGQANSNGQAVEDPTADVSKAPFKYLVPGKSDAWKVDDSQTVYDSAKGLVKLGVTFSHAELQATITQQAFPDQLKPRDGDAFRTFVAKTNPTRSVDVNGGTLFFLPMNENGALSTSGTDTVIFARDDVLIFGQAKNLLGWDAWTQIMTNMRSVSK